MHFFIFGIFGPNRNRAVATNSSTVWAESELRSWGNQATRAARSRGLSAPVGSVPRRTWPALGGTSPAMSRNSVLLPTPLGPSIASKSPGLTSRLTPESNSRPPRRTATSRRSNKLTIGRQPNPDQRGSHRVAPRRLEAWALDPICGGRWRRYQRPERSLSFWLSQRKAR